MGRAADSSGEVVAAGLEIGGAAFEVAAVAASERWMLVGPVASEASPLEPGQVQELPEGQAEEQAGSTVVAATAPSSILSSLLR